MSLFWISSLLIFSSYWILYISLHGYTKLCICLSSDGYLGLQFWTIAIKYKNLGVQVFLWTSASFFLSKYVGIEWLSHMPKLFSWLTVPLAWFAGVRGNIFANTSYGQILGISVFFFFKWTEEFYFFMTSICLFERLSDMVGWRGHRNLLSTNLLFQMAVVVEARPC